MCNRKLRWGFEFGDLRNLVNIVKLKVPSIQIAKFKIHQCKLRSTPFTKFNARQSYGMILDNNQCLNTYTHVWTLTPKLLGSARLKCRLANITVVMHITSNRYTLFGTSTAVNSMRDRNWAFWWSLRKVNTGVIPSGQINSSSSLL